MVEKYTEKTGQDYATLSFSEHETVGTLWVVAPPNPHFLATGAFSEK